jgi:hypothetical protein
MSGRHFRREPREQFPIYPLSLFEVKRGGLESACTVNRSSRRPDRPRNVLWPPSAA